MKVEQVEWKDEYNVGVEIVDSAHKKLFSICRKVTELLAEGNEQKNRYACEETIKFFKNYTLKHFGEEEAYMIKNEYAGYEMHKRLHDNLREVTLPYYEKKLAESDYSEEVILQFMAVVTGWLVGHIMVEDRAITGRTISRHSIENAKNNELVELAVSGFMDNAFSLKVEKANEHYRGETLGDVLNYEMIFSSSSGMKRKVVFLADKSLVRFIAYKALGAKNDTIDKASITVYTQLIQVCAKRLLELLFGSDDYELVSHRSPSGNDISEMYSDSVPSNSVLYETKEGRVGVIIP